LFKQRAKLKSELAKADKKQHHSLEAQINTLEKDPIVNSDFDSQFDDIERMADNQIAYWSAWKVICAEIKTWREADAKNKTKMPLWLRS
jgi:hypothetical protein